MMASKDMAKRALADIPAEDLPEPWKPKQAEPVELPMIPTCDFNDPGQLYAFFGPFGDGPNVRKIVLSTVRELIRAQFVLTGERASESRLDDLAHKHGVYVEWITWSIKGRSLYHAEAMKHGQGG